MTEKILTSFKQAVHSLKLIPSGGGCFELKVNGELIYSKLATGQFPDEKAILDKLATRLK